MNRLLRRIKQIRNRHRHHWKNAVWAWSKKGDGNWRRKLKRFRAYRLYAHQHEMWLMEHMKPGEKRKDRREELESAEKGAAKKIKHLKEQHKKHKPPSPSGQGFQTFDGLPVCGWMRPWIQKIRDRGWDGVVVSGVRTPAHSIELCEAMCGAPSCPGRCAGATSNHNATTCAFPQGALDVSDYVEFGYIARQVGAPFHNALPYDPVHFSNSGN